MQVLWQPKFILFALFIAAALYTHYRGQVRHNFARQFTDHSTFLSPLNVLIYLFSRVPTTPFIKTEELPEMQLITDNWQTIRDEGLRLLDDGMVRAAAGYNDLGFQSFFRHGWKRFYLKWYDDALPSAQQFCPATVALLKQVPSVHGAMFALLPPGSHLGAHRDPFAGSMRYHLGLRTPNDDACYIEVDGNRRSWRDGEAMMFDETYIHRAENKTDINRLILFCDVERPLRGWLPTAINRFIIHHIVKITATENVKGDGVGLANRMFAPIYQYRLLSKRFKKWNRKVYYTFKYSAAALILGLILFH